MQSNNVMYFFIDGYNLLFSWSEEKSSLENRRVQLVEWIQREFKRMRLEGTVVFDGSHRRDEESGRSYPSPLEIVFTPKGQSADEYIIERLEARKRKKTITVVTNDQGLRRHVRSFDAKTMSNNSFLIWLAKRERKRKAKKSVIFRESSFQEERLLKIFEERLKKSLDNNFESWE